MYQVPVSQNHPVSASPSEDEATRRRTFSINSDGSYEILGAEDLAIAERALDAFESLLVQKVKLVSRDNSREDYLMVTNSNDFSGGESAKGQSSSPVVVSHHCSLSTLASLTDDSTSSITSVDVLDRQPCADASASVACSLSQTSSLGSSASQVYSHANHSMSPAIRELQMTLESTTARVVNGRGERFHNEVYEKDGVFEANGFSDSGCVCCNNNHDPSDSLEYSGPSSCTCSNGYGCEMTVHDTNNCGATSSVGNTSSQSCPHKTGTPSPSDTSASTVSTKSNHRSGRQLVTDSVEELSLKVRSLDTQLLPRSRPVISQKSHAPICKTNKRHVSDPGHKPTTYIKITDMSRALSEPNEKDLVASEMLKLVERPCNWFSQSEPSSLTNQHRVVESRLPTEESIRNCILKNGCDFLTYTNWKCLFPHLMSNQLLDSDTSEYLMNEYLTNKDKGIRFYYSVLPSKGNTAYSRFYDSIACEQEHSGHQTLLEMMNCFSSIS